MTNSFLLDGEEVPFSPGQTVMQAASAAGKVANPCAVAQARDRPGPRARNQRLLRIGYQVQQASAHSAKPRPTR